MAFQLGRSPSFPRFGAKARSPQRPRRWASAIPPWRAAWRVLERQIGARLFERLPDRFVPTSAGEELLADTQAMEKAAHSIHRRSAGLSDTISGTVRLLRWRGDSRPDRAPSRRTCATS